MSSDSPKITLYWYEIKRNERKGAAWAELLYAAERVKFACEELASSTCGRNVPLALKRLAYHAENFLVRAYELRERAVRFIAIVLRDEVTARDVKNKKRQPEVIEKLGRLHAEVAQALDRLLTALDNEVLARNVHTHDTFLRIGLWTA